LMPTRVPFLVARVQHSPTMATAIGHQIDRHVHARYGHQRPRVTGMARLPARFAAALLSTPPDALTTGEAIRRRWFRRNCGVLVTKRQLAFEMGDLLLRVGDFFGRLGQLPLPFRQFAAKSFVLAFQPFLGVVARLSLGARHATHGTPIGSICTAPELLPSG